MSQPSARARPEPRFSLCSFWSVIVTTIANSFADATSSIFPYSRFYRLNTVVRFPYPDFSTLEQREAASARVDRQRPPASLRAPSPTFHDTVKLKAQVAMQAVGGMFSIYWLPLPQTSRPRDSGTHQGISQFSRVGTPREVSRRCVGCWDSAPHLLSSITSKVAIALHEPSNAGE